MSTVTPSTSNIERSSSFATKNTLTKTPGANQPATSPGSTKPPFASVATDDELVSRARGCAGSACPCACNETLDAGCPRPSTTTPRIAWPRVTSQRSPVTLAPRTITGGYVSAESMPSQRTCTVYSPGSSPRTCTVPSGSSAP